MPPLRTPSIQGRQKSCAECVKAKRRCDIAQPSCARCSRQSLSCIYPWHSNQTPALSDITSDHSDVMVAAIPTLQDAHPTISTFDPEVLDFPASLNDQLLDFGTPIDMTSRNVINQTSGTFADHGDHLTVHRSYSPMKLSDYSWTMIAPSSRSRVEYAIEQLKLAPRMMVANNSTLWCHPFFYDDDMPRPMQDAYAACALYNARNDTNTGFVIRHIASCVAELVAMPLPTVSTAIIARAHALLLYQVMLVFGDDIRFFSHSEAVVHHLEEVGCSLLDLSSQQTDPSDPLPLYPSTTAHAAWKSFIFRETLRRTVLSLYQFVAICRMLLGRLNNCAPSLSRGNYVTISARLWQAKSAFDFAMAWNKNQHFLVHELDFTDLLINGQPDDIDEFAKTMLVGLHGIDDIRGWLHERGGTL